MEATGVRSLITFFNLTVNILLGLTACEKDKQTEIENYDTGFLEIIPGIEISTLKSTKTSNPQEDTTSIESIFSMNLNPVNNR
jgi:hypothetical protein